MTEEQAKNIIEKGEGTFLEFKRCGNGIENDVYESVCSFSNRFGGYIFCGVLDDGTVNGVPEKAVKAMLSNFSTVISNPQVFFPVLYLNPEVVKIDGKTIIVIHVPVSGQVHSYKKVIYDRLNDSDIKVTSTNRIAEIYNRKQAYFTEQRVYKYVTEHELRLDLIERCKAMAVNKRKDHPWKNMTTTEFLKSAQLYNTDWNTGETGINLAGILLLGRDDVIGSVCPTYKTDALVRKIDVDRYDDREIIKTNLVESYDALIQFGRKHLLDKFFMQGVYTVSLRDSIVREMVSNVLMHREFVSSFVSKFVIESDRMFVENPCKPRTQMELTPDNFTPDSKNPIIASFFSTVGLADELGSGTRNLFKFVPLYSGKLPRMVEDDIFRIEVPLDDTYSADMDLHPVGTPSAAENKDLKSEDTIEFSENHNLSETQQNIVRLIRENPKITISEIANALEISTRAVDKHVKELKEKGILSRVGSKKDGKWSIRNA